ncbi:hypothetical protein HPB51_017716 [Rhipicephalus microplus]|uniref:Uncharacterized protein n=1 Tax=Rhipicephalus microplus TaxID=6941 RepID=A0A9J6E2P9_RHIMP|nr:hypothetical protein HPB51_017716 [Rhipicephalus microplus]
MGQRIIMASKAVPSRKHKRMEPSASGGRELHELEEAQQTVYMRGRWVQLAPTEGCYNLVGVRLPTSGDYSQYCHWFEREDITTRSGWSWNRPCHFKAEVAKPARRQRLRKFGNAAVDAVGPISPPPGVVMKRLSAASRLLHQPREHFRIIIRSRGGVGVRKISQIKVTQALVIAAQLALAKIEEVFVCATMVQNIFIISTPREKDTP